MEDDFNFFKNQRRRPQFSQNGRRPQFFLTWKTTSFCSKWKTTKIFVSMEDDLNIMENGRQSKYFGKGENKKNPIPTLECLSQITCHVN